MNTQSRFRIITVSLFVLMAILNFACIAIEILEIVYYRYHRNISATDYRNFEIAWIILLHLLTAISAVIIVYKFDDLVDESISKSMFHRILVKEYVYIAYLLLSVGMIVFNYLMLIRAIELFS